MKKLFALVLTLALVFAIAAPAMAATWGAAPAVTGSPFTVSVETYKVTLDSLGNNVYSPLGNAAVVEATPVAFKITIKVPTAAAAAAYYYDTTALDAFATVELTNLTDVAAAGTNTGFTLTGNDITVAVPALTTSAQTLTGTFTAKVATTAKALVEVAAGYEFTGAVADVDYAGYSFTNAAGTAEVTDGTNTLTLTKNTSDVVTGWSIAVGSDEYTVVSPTMFVQTVGTNPGDVLTSGAEFDAVNTVYKAFAALLGFNVTTAGVYFTDANILANYAAGGETAAVGTFLPYSSSLTVTDGTNVPNTGDNMSVIGFVMVGLALLATAAVIVKKVRA